MQKLLTTKEVKDILRVSDVTLFKLIRNGELPAIRFAGTRGYRVTAADLEEFLSRQQKNQEVESNV